MEAGTSTSPIKRRLTAILAADAVGYSRQMSTDEEGTLRVLAAQRAIIDRIIVAHGGRIVSTAGDSVLAEFASPVEAVRCAVEIQEALETRNAGLAEAERLVFRIGINLGDVMVDGADILGDGVNVAARLEGIADPGGICVSSSVYDQIVGKLSLGFVDIGEKSLKNIARPIRVYRFDRSGVSSPAIGSASIARKRRLAMGGAALLALLIGVGAWQAGVLQKRFVAPEVMSPAAPLEPPRAAELATSVRTPEPASEETKVKLQIAEAERAKAEAELAKSRAETEAAKQRAAAARTERKDVGAVPPASAAAALPAPQQLPQPVPQAAPPAAPPAGATPPVAPPASGPSMAAATPAPAGAGTAARSCEAWEDRKAFSDKLDVRVVNGEIVLERGEAGVPGWIRVSGRPSADGRLALVGTFIPNRNPAKGREYAARFQGTYADGQYALSGDIGKRPCTLIVRLNRQP